MSGYYLGVDTGATKSEALIADAQGQVIGYGRSGPGNWEVVGWEGTGTVLREIIEGAAASAGIGVGEIAASGLGLAGYDWPEDHAPHEALLRQIGLRGPLALANDAFPGLLAGAAAGWGVVVAAGTSCNCYGRDAQGRLGRLTGSSWLGEYAGSSELVHYALQAVNRAWSRRGPQTALTETLVQAAGARDAGDLFAGLMRGRYALNASHAPLVFETARAGDHVAIAGVEWAGRQLGELATGVIRQLGIEDETFEVVLAGSFFLGSERLEELVQEVVTGLAPQASTTRLTQPPVTGGVLLGMEAGGALTPQGRERVLRTAAALLE